MPYDIIDAAAVWKMSGKDRSGSGRRFDFGMRSARNRKWSTSRYCKIATLATPSAAHDAARPTLLSSAVRPKSAVTTSARRPSQL